MLKETCHSESYNKFHKPFLHWYPLQSCANFMLCFCSVSLLASQFDTVLKSRYLENNQLATIPQSISTLTNLQSLFVCFDELNWYMNCVNWCHVSPLASQFDTIFNSRYLSENQLEIIPESISTLTNLRSLFVCFDELNWYGIASIEWFLDLV